MRRWCRRRREHRGAAPSSSTSRSARPRPCEFERTADPRRARFFPKPEKGKEIQQAARNLALWSVILIGPEAAYRLPTYSACVADDLPRQTCADILPLVDWATHLVG